MRRLLSSLPSDPSRFIADKHKLSAGAVLNIIDDFVESRTLDVDHETALPLNAQDEIKLRLAKAMRLEFVDLYLH